MNKSKKSKKNKRFKKVLSLVLVVITVMGTVLPSFAQPRTIYDPLAMLDLLGASNMAPTIPNPSDTAAIQMPSLPGSSQSPNSISKPVEQITGPDATVSLPSLVDPQTGNLKFEEKDHFVTGLGYDLTLTRFNSENTGAFGEGWDLNFYTELRMYSKYDIGEVRVDGTQRAYVFVQDDPNAFITRYDGDPMVNYELNKGHYETAAGDTLTRISATEYQVVTKLGETFIYQGYRAPWRSANSPKEGKLIKRIDINGNAIAYDYDASGRLTSLTNQGRTLLITYGSNGFISVMTDPMGQTVNFAYTGNKLSTVTYPNGEIKSYEYSGTKITRYKTGGDDITFSYQDGKITKQSTPVGVQYTYTYTPGKTIVTNALGGWNSITYDDKNILSREASNGDKTVYTIIKRDNY